jgi:hypothetical protein
MMRIQAASDLTLHQVTRQFRVQRCDDPAFFPEWREGLADLGDRDRLALDDLKADYLHLAQYTLQEPLVKMVVIAPLLKLAGFYQKNGSKAPPF